MLIHARAPEPGTFTGIRREETKGDQRLTNIPLNAAVAGSVGSEQKDGMETANGLKFFSA